MVEVRSVRRRRAHLTVGAAGLMMKTSIDRGTR